jgi:hypothetical protein
MTELTMEREYPITVHLNTGTELHVIATRDTIESFGSVNQLVHHMIKPLEDVTRIEVELYCEELEDTMKEVTYDVLLEAWKNLRERVVITYDFYGTGIEEEEERGFIDFKDGWLPCYTLRKTVQAIKMHDLMTSDIVRIQSTKVVNGEAKRQRGLDAYYADPQKANQQKADRERAKREKVAHERKLARERTNRYRAKLTDEERKRISREASRLYRERQKAQKEA